MTDYIVDEDVYVMKNGPFDSLCTDNNHQSTRTKKKRTLLYNSWFDYQEYRCKNMENKFREEENELFSYLLSSFQYISPPIYSHTCEMILQELMLGELHHRSRRL